MIKNRLIYGTGFRADLITLTHIENMGMKGTELARLLYANTSTVSRILNDLKASRFLNQDAERVGSFESYPRMFVSVISVQNLCEMMDATRFSLRELKQRVLENLNFKHDGFGCKISEKVF
jgi:DNA-binding IclR family transcriptional regulator